MINQKTKNNRRPGAAGMKKKPGAKGVKQKKLKLSVNRSDLFTILWIIIFFPVGLTRMWKDSCRWKSGVKYAVSCLCVAAIAGVVVIPSPYKAVSGGVEIVAEDPEVEVYGPSAPKTIVSGYSSLEQESVITDAAAETEESLTVYAAEGARCYHLGDCKFAFASAKRLSVYEAYFLGYDPCGACNPPTYDPVTGKTVGSTAGTTETTSEATETSESVLTDAQTQIEDFDDGTVDIEV